MKAEITPQGQLGIVAENNTEIFALKTWLKTAYVERHSMERMEEKFFRAECFLIIQDTKQ